LLYTAISASLFAQRVVHEPHVYSRLEWTNVAISFAATICRVPLGIVSGALREGRHLRATRYAGVPQTLFYARHVTLAHWVGLDSIAVLRGLTHVKQRGA
jgi:hypothetical protein